MLIVSDSERLATLIERNLDSRWQVERRATPPEANAAPLPVNAALIILALSSTASEPLVLAAQARLASYLGRVPFLIISDRPFPPSPAEQIMHLDFPFRAEAFQFVLRQLLAQLPRTPAALDANGNTPL